MNVLLITMDQFRGDCLSSAGHPVVRTPSLDRLAAEGLRLSRHYSQSAPCAPARACLYTGTYQMNNRVVGNGTPLDDRFDNVARVGQRAGYAPTVFGYADQSTDPRLTLGPDDRRLWTYQGFPPGFEVGLGVTEDQDDWRAHLADLGYGEYDSGEEALATEPERPAELGQSAFLTDNVIEWLERRDDAWFAHVSYSRPHPPYAAAGHWSSAYHPDDMPVPVPSPPRDVPFCGNLAAFLPPGDEEGGLRGLQAQYFGMISDVDCQLGRMFDALVDLGMWDDTFVVVTADHGEQLGDQGAIGKGGMFEASYHIPCIVRDPRHPDVHGSAVDVFTESVDILPTICEAIGVEVPAQCDGLPLTPFLRGEQPPWWRTVTHWEYDWRWERILFGPYAWPWDRQLESMHLAVSRSETTAYIQLGDGQWRCFDLAADPWWRVEVTDPARVLEQAQGMLAWRANHADRTFTDMLVMNGGVGRMPQRLD
jgi:arylsulfatase A-like enzyme